MRIVAFNLKVFGLEVIDCLNFSKDSELGERPWFSLKLKTTQDHYFPRSIRPALIFAPHVPYLSPMMGTKGFWFKFFSFPSEFIKTLLFLNCHLNHPLLKINWLKGLIRQHHKTPRREHR